MWVIWRERNTCIFDGNERSIHELKLLFFQTLFDWANATGAFTFISLLDMLDFCTFIVTFFFPVCLFPFVFSLLFSMKLLLFFFFLKDCQQYERERERERENK